MKCPKCDYRILDPIKRKHDTVRILESRVLIVDELIMCQPCQEPIRGRWNPTWDHRKESDRKQMEDPDNMVRLVVLANEGGLLFTCEECGHKELKTAMSRRG